MIVNEPEYNIRQFNEDVDRLGSYAYTKSRYSSQVATLRQTDSLVAFLGTHFSGPLRILDVGCGDGTFTNELALRLPDASFVGFDAAERAVEHAALRYGGSRLQFRKASAYDTHSVFAGQRFDVAVVRGLLHHLYEPERAIASLAGTVGAVLILEPNGANPVMKGIEQLSAYHRAHEEKSYWPPALNKWFANEGLQLVEQRFIGLVPYFCPTWAARFLKVIEPVAERMPVVRFIGCGTNVALYKRHDGAN